MSNTKIPRGVWALGLVSLCMDLSSEMIHALLPVFMKTVLGVGLETIGLIEGIAEATASITKVFSGVLSDRFARRKPLVLFGYGLAAITKPLFPLAQSAAAIFAARFIDRIGKGIRGAPRDALVADLTTPDTRGAAFGLRQALDTAGALIGPLIAIGLLIVLTGDDGARIKTVFWIAVIPAAIAVVVLAIFVHEPAERETPSQKRSLFHSNELAELGPTFWSIAIIGGLFALARFSEAFLILKASDARLPLTLTPLALATMNVTYVASSYPFGKLSDRIGRVWLLTGGMVVLIAADFLLAFGQSLSMVFVGIAVWGIHLGMTQGLLSALVADAAPQGARGSAFGAFYCISGLAALLASFLAGSLWAHGGPRLTFLAGAAIAIVALISLIACRRVSTCKRHTADLRRNPDTKSLPPNASGCAGIARTSPHARGTSFALFD